MNMQCFDVTLFCTIIGAAVGTIALVYAFLRNFKQDVKEWRMETKAEISVIRQEISEMKTEMRAQSQRTDQLYQMFVDLLKAQNPKTNP